MKRLDVRPASTVWPWIAFVVVASLLLSRAFAPAVVSWIFAVNAVALGLLFAARRLAATIGGPAWGGPVSPRA